MTSWITVSLVSSLSVHIKFGKESEKLGLLTIHKFVPIPLLRVRLVGRWSDLLRCHTRNFSNSGKCVSYLPKAPGIEGTALNLVGPVSPLGQQTLNGVNSLFLCGSTQLSE